MKDHIEHTPETSKRNGRRLTRDEKLSARVSEFERKAVEAENAGRTRWAGIYRERAQRCRDGMSSNDGAHFQKCADEAAQLEKLSEDFRRKGNLQHVEHLVSLAEHYRKDACRFDSWQVLQSYREKVVSTSIGLNRESLEILDSLGVPRKDFGRVLSRFLEEALCAIDDAQAGRAFDQRGRLRLSASLAEDGRAIQREKEAVSAEASIAFQLARATHGESE